MLPHSLEEWLNIINRFWSNQLAIVEPQAYPQVVHEDGKADHHGCDSERSPEFVPLKLLFFKR